MGVWGWVPHIGSLVGSTENFNDIESNASLSISKQYDYDNELFSLQSQRDLVLILDQEVENSKF